MIKHTLNMKEEQGFTVAKYYTRLPIIHTQVGINFIKVVKKKQGKQYQQKEAGKEEKVLKNEEKGKHVSLIKLNIKEINYTSLINNLLH